MKRLAFMFAVATLACGAMAFPTMQFLGKDIGLDVQVSFDGGANFANTFGGDFNMRADLSASNSYYFKGFCLAPNVHMSDGNVDVTITDTNSYPYQNSPRVGYLIATYGPTVFSGPNDSAHQDLALAVQVSIWELLVESNSIYDVNTGAFRARGAGGNPFTGNQTSLINSMLNSTQTGMATVYMAARNGQGLPVSQDIGTVPEPASIVLLALGTLGMARRKRRV